MKAIVCCFALLGILRPITPRAIAFGASAHPASQSSPAHRDRCWAPPEPAVVTVVCFPPAQMAEARRVAPAMVDPSPAVGAAARLRLTDVVIMKHGGRVSLVMLLYGNLKFSRPPAPAPLSTPRFLDIDEATGRKYHAYTNSVASHREAGGLIVAQGYLPSRNLSFRVSAFASPSIVQQIARSIIDSGRAGQFSCSQFAQSA